MQTTPSALALLVIAVSLLAAAALAEPLTIQETGILTVSDAYVGDRITTYLAKHGNMLLVGSEFDDTACPNADGTEWVDCNSGSVYVFRRNPAAPTTWEEVRKLTASDQRIDALFGYPVVFDGSTAVIGAYADNAAGEIFPKGAAYIFERNLGGPDGWGERAKLVPPDETPIFFGTALALQGNTLVVTAPSDAYPCPDEPQFCVAGSAYVFERHRGGPNAWGLVRKIIPPDGAAQQNFGMAAALQGDALLVVASTAPPTDPFPSGVIYEFRRNQGGSDNWGFTQRFAPAIVPHNSGSALGWYNALSLVGDTLAVGAQVDSRACDFPVSFCGAVHLFARSPQGLWSETKVIPPPEPRHEGGFGRAVALFGEDLLLVVEDGPPEQVYTFARNLGGQDAWGLAGTLVPSDISPGEDIGFGASLTTDRDGQAAVGAIFSDRACPPDIPFCDAGAVYLYDLAPLVGGCVETPTTLCLAGNRFRVEVSWETPRGNRGAGQVGGHLGDNGGYFWFFQETNPELLVKVVNACGTQRPRFWFFSAGLTNVGVEILVTDTATGATSSYANPVGQDFLPILDTNAFDTCP